MVSWKDSEALSSYEIYRKFTGSSLTLERTTVHVSDDTGRIAMVERRAVGTDTAPALLKRFIYSHHLQSASLELNDTAAIISYEEYHPYGTTAYQSTNAAIKAINGIKKPSPAQTQRILEGVRQMGRELAEARFLM